MLSLGEVVRLGLFGSETLSRVTQLKIGDICLLVGEWSERYILAVENAKLGIIVFGFIAIW